MAIKQRINPILSYIPESPCKSVYGIRNGKVSAKGQSLNFECRKGYVLEGASTITCQTSGDWDSAVPTCRSKYKYLL